MEQSDIDLLQTVPSYHLQSLVKTRRLPMVMKGQGSSTTTTKTPTGNLSAASIPDVQEVAAFLFKSAVIGEALRSLGPVEQMLLRELVACGGRANSRDLAFYMTSSGLLAVGKGSEVLPTYGLGGSLYPTPHPHGVFELALHRLLLLGLLFWGKQTNFAGRDYTSGVYDGVLIVPQAVKHIFNETLAQEELSPVPVQEMATPDANADKDGGVQDIGDGTRSLQRTLYLYWSFVALLRDNNGQKGLPLVQNGLLSRSGLRQIVDVLYPKMRMEQVRVETDIPHLLFIRLLLMALGLLREQGGLLCAAPARDYFMLPLLERARRCYRLWLETPFWNELPYLSEVALRPVPPPLEPAQKEVMQGHATIVARIAHELPDEWHDVATFIARTKLYVPYLLFPRQYGPRTERYSLGSNPYGWDFRLRHGWLTPREGWYQVEGGFIRSVVTGPLHWLGLVDTKIEDKRTLFRLSPGFSMITGNTQPEIAEEAPGRLIVQPNFELVALAPISEAMLIRLDRFAERVSLEHVAQYRLTKASVTHAIQRGLHADTIQRVIEEAAGSEMPQNVRYSLVEWERQARRVELWQGMSLLEVDDAQLLDDLFADPTSRLLFGRRLAPTLAEVDSRQLATVQSLLWQRDYLPALVSATQHDDLLENALSSAPAHEPQWRLHDNGLLQPLYPVLDLYLVAEAERFTEAAAAMVSGVAATTDGAELEDTVARWRRITPASMQHATANGLPLAAIIRFLQRYCTGGVPASFLIRLKLWSGGYGTQPTIQVEQSPMLYLPAQVLHDLQSDEDLQFLLGPEIPQQGRLVRVPQEHLARVVELLKERGFAVE